MNAEDRSARPLAATQRQLVRARFAGYFSADVRLGDAQQSMDMARHRLERKAVQRVQVDDRGIGFDAAQLGKRRHLATHA